MPKYDYKCGTCEYGEEIERSISDPEIKPVCPECNLEMSRVYNNFGIQFKGSGFYNTDNRRK